MTDVLWSFSNTDSKSSDPAQAPTSHIQEVVVAMRFFSLNHKTVFG